MQLRHICRNLQIDVYVAQHANRGVAAQLHRYCPTISKQSRGLCGYALTAQKAAFSRIAEMLSNCCQDVMEKVFHPHSLAPILYNLFDFDV